MFRSQSCEYGSGRFGARVRFVSGVANVPGAGGFPLNGSEKFGTLICAVCKYGGALIGDCSGPPCPV